MKKMNHFSTTIFPFSAIVGQEKVKRIVKALLVHRQCGPLLISGPQGTGKSVLVRSIAVFMEEGAFHTVPIHITEDMLFGSIDMEKTLKKGRRHRQAGLLEKAYKECLFIDDAPLLEPTLLSHMLRINDEGFHRVEREGFSYEHPVDSMIIGTMNSTDQHIEPFLLQGFPLYVSMETITDSKKRQEIIRRRLLFEEDKAVFWQHFGPLEEELYESLSSAKKCIETMEVGAPILALAAQLALQSGVKGQRADRELIECGKALAALEGRTYVLPEDIEEAAYYVLPHKDKKDRSSHSEEESTPPRDDTSQDRDTTDSSEESSDETNDESHPNNDEESAGDYEELTDGEEEGEMDQDEESSQGNSEMSGSPQDDTRSTEDGNGQSESAHNQEEEASSDSGDAEEQIAPLGMPLPLTALLMPSIDKRLIRRGSGKRSLTRTDVKQGRYVRPQHKKGAISDIALDATLRAAAPYQKGRLKGDRAVAIEENDIRHKVREKRIGNTFIFAVDASGSMGAKARMTAVKGAILTLLYEAYENRDKVSLIAFRRDHSEVLLPITRSVELAQKCLATLPTGGKTPLAEGLEQAYSMIQSMNRRDAHMEPILVLITDGRANYKDGKSDPVEKAMAMARYIRDLGVKAIVIDTEADFVKLDIAKEVAHEMEAIYYSLQGISKEKVLDLIRR